MPDMSRVKKTIRLILNILFVIVVVAAIIAGWGKEVDDPDAWFPEWVEEKEEPAQTQEVPVTPQKDSVQKVNP